MTLDIGLKDRRFIYAFLWRHGRLLFDGALPVDANGNRVIKAVVCGFTDEAKEMLKALIWYCQMKGWFLDVYVLTDDSSSDEAMFASMCPEIMGDGFNGATVFGDPCYHMGFTSDASVLDGNVSFAFASRDCDAATIKASCSNALILFEDSGDNLADDSSCFAFEDADIDVATREMEEAGLKRHLVWGTEPEFWSSSYNYSSSISSAMHIRLRRELGIPGADKDPDSRTDYEKEVIERIEHARWSSWLRTEGWCYAPVRDNAQKKHHLLIPFDKLDAKEKDKDNV